MIPVTLFNVRFSSPYPLDFGANPGSSLRGAFYEALHTLYDDGSNVHSRHDQSNVVAWLMRLEDQETSGGKDVPRPIAFRPPTEISPRYYKFGLAVYGQAQLHHNLIFSAIHAMQHIGIGRGRNHFTLEGIDQVDPVNQQIFPFLNQQGELIAAQRAIPSAQTYHNFAGLLCQDHLTVQFLSPTRIIRDGHLMHKPLFHIWFQRLLERVRLLSEHYCEQTLFFPFRDLLNVAEKITIENDQTHWHEQWSGSRRDGELRPTSGFIGRVSYKGECGALLPYIILGQSLQVGKNVIKGCGWYALEYEWQ